MTDQHPWQEATSLLTAKLKQPIDSSIVLCNPSAGEEVICLDKEGFHYRGQFIEDAGEAHRLMVAFLRQGTAPVLAEQPVGPTDEELLQIFDTVCLSEGGTVDEIHLRGLRAVLARWGQL